VLVVDDEEAMGILLRRALRGCDVTAMTSAVQALAAISGGARFDLILCDLAMPVMTGLELYEALREAAPTQADAIIFLTGGVISASVDDFLRALPNTRIGKPFELAHLKSVVNARLSAPRGPSPEPVGT